MVEEIVPSTDQPHRGELTPLTVAGFVLRHRRLLGGLPVLAFGLSLGLSFVLGVGFASRSSFVPESRDASGVQVSALAAQFGLLGGGGAGASESVEFYATLLRSPELLTQAVLSVYAIPGEGADSVRGTLVDLWGVRGPDSVARVRRATDQLDRHVSVSTSREANTVTLVTRDERQELAVQVNRRLLDLVGEFNLQKRQSRAMAERRFTAERLVEAREELDQAEAGYRRFLEQNREYQASPQLRFEAFRLERQVGLRQEVQQSLAQSYEQSRIDEVRNTPVLTVVDHPEYSIRRARSRLTDAVVWGVLAGMLALMAAVTIEYVRRQRIAGSQEYLAVRASLEGMWGIGWFMRRMPTGR